MTFTHIILPIMGFTEHRNRETGIKNRWREIYRMEETRDSRVWVMGVHTWDNDWADVAGYVEQEAAPSARVLIVAHSWGVGWGARKFSEHTSLPVEIVSADGVSRSDLFPPFLPGNPLSLTGLPTIKLPENVKRFDGLYQRQPGLLNPRGHYPEFPTPNGQVKTWACVRVPHNQVDDHPAFAGLTHARVKQFLS